jgi:membrane-associated phospholipid phosphatase
LQIFCRPIKKLTHRTRPDYSKRIPRAWNLYGKIREASSDGYSFPSGDAMSGGAVAGSLIHATGSWWWLALALYPSFGRVYWHYHYIGDVLSGAGLGLAAAAINAQIFGTRPVAGVEVTACLVLFVAFMKFTASPPPKEKAN